ncbi:MAG: hypothetical protein HQL13_01200 [Candidatus Omnitrophica bacterium]|nr:hypothetical protein [Candidatus Omnitrophota bacterium]
MTHARLNPHPDDKTCLCHHEHCHEQGIFSFLKRWAWSLVIVIGLLGLLRPWMVGQMLGRVESYSSNGDYKDVIRVCKKIIMIDKDNKQAWTALGLAYMALR